MSLLSMKSEFLIPEKELIINKNIIIGEIFSIICSLTEQDNIIKLWVLQKTPVEINVEEMDLCPDYLTNRDEVIRNSNNQRESRFISQISIQGILFNISGSSSGLVSETPMSFAKLQHFMEVGIDFTEFEDFAFNELFLTEYRLEENTIFPEIEKNNVINISLNIGESFYPVLLAPSLEFNLKIGKHDLQSSFIDTSGNEIIDFYINNLYCYDIWSEHINRLNDEETITKLKENGLDDIAIEKMKEEAPNHLKNICPEGYVLLVLEYGCDHQLNFYTTDFLNSKPSYNGSACGIIFSNSDSDSSCHDKKIRTSLLKTVPIGFNEDVKIELLSWYKTIPLEIIEFDF